MAIYPEFITLTLKGIAIPQTSFLQSWSCQPREIHGVDPFNAQGYQSA